MMDYATFLELVSKTDRRWELINGKLRLNIGMCFADPITALTGEKATYYAAAGRKLELEADLVNDLVEAADHGDLTGEDAPRLLDIRADLFVACGLMGEL